MDHGGERVGVEQQDVDEWTGIGKIDEGNEGPSGGR